MSYDWAEYSPPSITQLPEPYESQMFPETSAMSQSLQGMIDDCYTDNGDNEAGTVEASSTLNFNYNLAPAYNEGLNIGSGMFMREYHNESLEDVYRDNAVINQNQFDHATTETVPRNIVENVPENAFRRVEETFPAPTERVPQNILVNAPPPPSRNEMAPQNFVENFPPAFEIVAQQVEEPAHINTRREVEEPLEEYAPDVPNVPNVPNVPDVPETPDAPVTPTVKSRPVRNRNKTNIYQAPFYETRKRTSLKRDVKTTKSYEQILYHK